MDANSNQKATVYIVDDESAIRHAMGLLMLSVGLDHEIYCSADEFLANYNNERAGCLVLDIRMPGLGGLELQKRLNDMGSALPVIFITGHGDIPMAVEAIQKGAVDFIQKPFRDQDLLDRVIEALQTNKKRRSDKEAKTEIQGRIKTLTIREHQVLELVAKGDPNKTIAHKLGVSQRTVEIHRARVMEKMNAKSLADLVRKHVSI